MDIDIILEPDVTPGQMAFSYEGSIFHVTRPFQMDWAKSRGPLIYGCCSGPMMIRMGARVADGIQVSDFTPEMMPDAMENVNAGMAKREKPANDFRIGNFWACRRPVTSVILNGKWSAIGNSRIVV